MSSRLALLFAFAACSTPPVSAPPDAGVIPRSPEGRFAVTSRMDLASPIPGNELIANLVAATDGPDDPSRYIVDRLVDALPEGHTKTVARTLAPLIAAYLNDRIMTIAPRFVAGVDGIVAGINRISHHFDLIERLHVSRDGAAVRTISGVRFEIGPQPIDVAFGADGLADLSVVTQVALDKAGKLAVSDHVIALPYGRVLRLGLDHAVIPSVDPTATDLARALRDLVDCGKLGALVADRVGIGPPTFYEAACATAMTAAASELYGRLATIDTTPLSIELTGTARAIDLDGNGTMDAFDSGMWKGATIYGDRHTTLGAATFTGTSQ